MIDHHQPRFQGNIIAADDNQSDLNLLVEILTKNGYNVQPYLDGPSALSRARAEPSALILLGTDMPQMDGYEICRQLKTDERTANIPVIFLTTSNELFNRAELFAAGGADHITKPFEVEEVLAIVETHLSLHTMQQRLDAQAALLQQETIERQRVEAELQKHHEHLETLVEARTAELQATNEQLQQEIIKHKQPMETLRDHEDHYRHIVETTREGIWIIDADSNTTFVNQRMADMLGYSVDEMMGQILFAFMDEEGLAISKANVERRQQGIAEQHDFKFQRKDGTDLWTLLETNPIYDETGNYIGALAMVSDITERKRVEEALKQSQALLDESQRLVHIGSWDMDIETGQINWTDEAFRIFGHRPREFQPTFEIFINSIHPDDQGMIPEHFQETLATKKFGDFDYRVRWPDGTVHWIHATGEVYTDAAGTPVRIIGTVQDITERKQAEEALQLTRFTVESIADTMFWLDSEARIIDVNKAACDNLGYTREELLNMSLFDIVLELTPENWPEEWNELKEKGTVTRERTHRTKDGQTFPVEIVANYIEFDGRELDCAFARDISERKQAEEALQLTRLTVESVADTMFWMDSEARIIDVNKAACDTLGYTREELRNMSLFDIDPDFTAERWRKAWRQLKENGMLTRETTHRAKDGRIIPVEIVANYIEFEGRELDCAFARDISERKQAEKSLHLTRFMVEHISDALYWIDPKGRILDINEAACRMLGYTREELTQMSVFEIDKSPPFTFGEHSEFRKTLRQKGTVTFETQHTSKDGQAVPVEVVVNIIEFDGQEYNCAFARDITERKWAEEALRESEERLQQVVRVSRIGIFDHDHLSDTIYWSPEQREIYGWGPEETVTLTKFIEQVHPEDREGIGEAVGRAHDPAGDGLFDVEYRIIRRDGAIRWLSTRSQTFFAEEGRTRRTVRTVGATLDVTEAKLAEEEQAKLEEQLRQAQKLESIGQLAGGIAHDFNNLLLPIIGYAELSQMGLSPSSKLYTDLEKIKTAAERAASLTRQILAFSRRQVLEVQVFNLNEVIIEFQEMLRRLITEDIDVQIFLSPNPCMLQADRAQIEQLLLNLSVNARDAMLDGGKLIIETDNVFLDETYAQTHSETEPGHYVMLSLSDTGDGMDADIQEQIFEPFFTTKEQGKGTGLGLAMVFGIVKQHQGNIWVYSEPGQGTIFKIYLPRSEDTSQLAATTTPDPASVYGTETVVVVEDEPMVRKLACETLEAYGYRVIEAESTGDGLQLASAYENTIHLLLTDVVMPDMNGRELYEKLATVRPDLKVLYMSGYTDNVIVHHGVLDKKVNFIQKPFTVRGLTQKVRRVLD